MTPNSGGLTNRWSGRVKDKVPNSSVGVRTAQLNRYAALNAVPASLHCVHHFL
jgi:hypothetical protein